MGDWYVCVQQDVCVSCGACVPECPAVAIYTDDGATYCVDQDKCSGGGGCGEDYTCWQICPTAALGPNDTREGCCYHRIL